MSTCPTRLCHVCSRPSHPIKDFLPSYPCYLAPLPPSQALEVPEALSLSHYFWNPSAPHRTRTRVSKPVTLKAALYALHLLALVLACLPKSAPLSPDFQLLTQHPQWRVHMDPGQPFLAIQTFENALH